jgi:hypothetical protein
LTGNRSNRKNRVLVICHFLNYISGDLPETLGNYVGLYSRVG